MRKTAALIGLIGTTFVAGGFGGQSVLSSDAPTVPTSHFMQVVNQLHKERKQTHKAVSIRTKQVRHARVRVADLRKQLLNDSTVREAIWVAAVTYRQSASELTRTAYCESRLNPGSRNGEPIYNGEHATGLFQFVPSTWRSTPYKYGDIYNANTNALAAAWMWAQGRRNEWTCR